MILNNLFIITIGKISLLWLIMYLLIVALNHFRLKSKYSKEELIKSPILAKIYLDQFYVTNKLYTFFMTVLYVFGMVIIFILIRYASIEDIVSLLPKNNLYTSLLQIVFVYLMVFVTLMLYRTLIIMLFKKEVNKLYIYLQQLNWYYEVKNLIRFKLGNYIFGRLYLITYRIATLSYKESMFPIDIGGDDHYLLDDEADYVIYNKKVIGWAYKMKDLATDDFKIQKLFRILAYIFGFMFKHVSNLHRQVPYFIVIMIFLIDLYNQEFHHIYLASFIFLLIKTKHNLETFINHRSYYDIYLRDYFYKNEIPYEKQRMHFYDNNVLTIQKSFTSMANKNLERNIKDIIEYTFKDFTFDGDSQYKKTQRREGGIYRRFLILISFIGIGYFILLNTYLEVDNMPKIILLTPIIVMVYSHYKTYHGLTFHEGLEEEECVYSRTYNTIFWIATIIQGYIFWILILKPQLIFIETEILLELPYDILKITRIYTLDEKIMYLYQYFEYYVQQINMLEIDTEYIRYMLRQINYEILIDNTVMLKDIKVYIKLLIDNYYLNKMFYTDWLPKYLISEEINPWYILLRNTIGICAITLTLIQVKNILLVATLIYTNDKSLYKDIHNFSKFLYKYYPMRDDIDVYHLYQKIKVFFGW
jgi:hypothetical protein